MELKVINDRDKWNKFIESHESSHAFQLYEWGEIKKIQGWKPIRLGLLDKDENLIAGAQILFKNLPFSLKIAQIPFGPVLDYYNSKILEKFFNELYQFIKSKKYLLVLLEPYLLTDKNIKIPYTNPTLNQLYYRHTILINLNKSEEDIFCNFRKTYQNEIRQAQKDGIEIIENTTKDGISEFYKMYSKMLQEERRKGLPKNLFYAIVEFLFLTGSVKLFFAKIDHQNISTALTLYSGKTCVYMYAASTTNPELKKLPGQKLTIWYIIKDAKKNGYHFFDIGGVTPTAKQGTKRWGIYFFKKGFGGDIINLLPTHEIGFNKPLLWLSSLLLKIKDKIKI